MNLIPVPGGDVAGEDVIDNLAIESDGTDAASNFAAFYAASFARSARLAYLLTGDEGGSEDIAQEALSRIQPRFETIESPRAYLRKVIVNLAKRHGMNRDRDRAARERLGPPDVEALHAQELLDVIGALPLRQRAVVVLRYYEDLTEAEIAQALECRPGTVKSLGARALARLRKELDS